MSQLLKNLKELIKAEKFVLIFIVLISATLVYLLVKSPSIKTTTEIQLDGETVDSSTIQVDSVSEDTLYLRVGE
jgi:hypothetical protein